MPAVPVRKSITPGFLICLDDGKKFKSLKRHLASLGMTPGQYRKKWGLPKDYPWRPPNMLPRGRRSRKKSALDGWSTTRESRSREECLRRCQRRLRRRASKGVGLAGTRAASIGSEFCGQSIIRPTEDQRNREGSVVAMVRSLLAVSERRSASLGLWQKGCESFSSPETKRSALLLTEGPTRLPTDSVPRRVNPADRLGEEGRTQAPQFVANDGRRQTAALDACNKASGRCPLPGKLSLNCGLVDDRPN